MTVLEQRLTLSNGVKIPVLGLGTWLIDDDKVADAVVNAVKIGYRHIDTAELYGNERGVGEGIRKCGLPRNELFVTTKLAAEYKEYEGAKKAIQKSLDLLDIDYIDLMVIHSPQPWDNFRDGHHYEEGNLAAWKALEEFYQAGKIKAIGVSNFEKVDIENLLAHGTVKPMVNQVLAHVTNTPFELIDYCKSKDIVVEAYSPLGHGEIMKNPALIKMADTYHVSVPQLCIRYALQLGLVPIPKTTNPDYMRNNASVDFEISDEDMEILKKSERIQDYGKNMSIPCYNKLAVKHD